MQYLTCGNAVSLKRQLISLILLSNRLLYEYVWLLLKNVTVRKIHYQEVLGLNPGYTLEIFCGASNFLVRPIINNIGSVTYKLAKRLVTQFQSLESFKTQYKHFFWN